MQGPGVEVPKFKDIDRLADRFETKREERSKISEDITELEKKIAEAMKEHGITKYRYRDQEVILKTGKTHIKVRTIKSEGVEPDDQDGSESIE